MCVYESQKLSFRNLKRLFLNTPPFRANEVLEDEHLWALKSRMILPASISSSLLDKCVFVFLRVGVSALATEDSKGGG